ncbi:MAG: aminotransferase class I/II-fold pyridoxal phosphate-dependent enzyme [Acidobacteriales bacterium]|nr:aminotransferase class I/II-fold pyridoxal phosphate-dependent enzyme [Terriglobales bacterium]
MTYSRTTTASPYMQFAKLRSGATYALATSGIASYPLAELPVQLDQLEINGPTVYGYQPLLDRLAALNGVPSECVVSATGTSFANHLAMAATFEPGDEVLIESPTYELLLSTARFLGAGIRRFPRRLENSFAIDPSDIAAQITNRTRLIVLTNLHNPTGALVDEETLREIGEIAAKSGARVLVDEVYLESLYKHRPKPAVHLGPQFVVTSSLTKAYGLSGIRCGWVLAEAELARRMWFINDLYAATPVFPAEQLGVIALDNLERIASRAEAILENNRPAITQFLDSHPELICARPAHGTVYFPGRPGLDTERLLQLLQTKYDTSIVPGTYFEMPEHFRIGIGGEPEATREGLLRLGRAFDGIY